MAAAAAINDQGHERKRMLPGLRILFAITLLSVSVLIFGLGAAAFLRSAHEDVANAPWRPIETPATARVDLAPPTLAMLQVEPEAIAAAPAPGTSSPVPMAAPAETEIGIPSVTAASTEAPPPRAEPTQAPAAAQSAEEPSAPAQASTPASPTLAAPVPEPAREAPSPSIVEAVETAETKSADTQPADPATADTKAADAKAADAEAADTKTSGAKAVEPNTAEATELQPAPTVVSSLGADKAEQAPAKTEVEPASAPTVVAPPPAAEAPASTAAPAETAAGTDTLKADDKAIQAAPATKIAALGETAADQAEPLPPSEVRLPNPRVDPAVIEARRKEILAQQQARARLLRARRIAAARARAAAQARAAAAAANPFGAPANSTTNNSTPNTPRAN